MKHNPRYRTEREYRLSPTNIVLAIHAADMFRQHDCRGLEETIMSKKRYTPGLAFEKSVKSMERTLSTEQIDELTSGDGVYYVTQETALCPGISGEWPGVIKHPTNKNGRLVRRQAEKS